MTENHVASHPSKSSRSLSADLAMVIKVALRDVIRQQQVEITGLRQQAREDEQAREKLEAALVSARKIGAAIGVVMRDRLVSYEQAFALLSRTSQTTNRKLRDIEDDVLTDGHLQLLVDHKVATATARTGNYAVRGSAHAG